jgi:preprotein translocase subunit SecD
MKKNLRQRTIIILVVTIASLYYVIGPHRMPRASDFTAEGIKRNLSENIRLGLDLKGGSHLVMQVQTDKYLEKVASEGASALRQAATANGYQVKDVRPEIGGGNYRIVLETDDTAKLGEMRDTLPGKAAGFNPNDWSVNTSGNRITWELSGAAQRTLAQSATEQAYRIVDSRINQFGVAEPTLQYHGAQESHQILLQMPGLQDPERVKKLLSAESRLELVHVISPPSPAPVQKYATKEEAIATFLGGNVPANRKVVSYVERDEPTAAGGTNDENKDRPKSWVIVETPPVVDGSELRSADAVSRTGQGNDFQIAFALKPSGAEKFGRWTGQNINQYMGVLLNDEVKSIAYIKSQITDSGEISGNFTRESANDLVLTLRSGALPAPIRYQEERTVGPSLGADSIRAGVTASIAGLIFVILFMVFYYRGSGVNAVVALLLNLILTVAALVLFNATLTLPGIAGLILTIGMAVDSNVLIFERIREELRTGKTVASAVEQGFGRAFVTIIDTHVTTIVSALFLFIFGTGPIRGFAVTLVLGLLANLFSAVYVSRTIFIWVLSRKGRRAETLSI